MRNSTVKARRKVAKMVELELVGIHDDGEHLIFEDAANQRYQLAITEQLRAAVRRDRPQMEHLRSNGLRPREIQALIRSGASAEEVAEEAGVAVESVRRYEGPVLAEREFAAERARGLRTSRREDAPTLGDLVVDRLAARNVSEIAWDAYRPDNEPWRVTAQYRAGQQDFLASWEVDLVTGTFTAIDDEARWLSEIDLADSPYRHLTPVEDRFYDVESDGGIPTESEDAPETDATDAILQELDAARGVHQPLDPEAHSEPTLWDDPPAAHPPLSRPQEARDATVLQLPEKATPVESESTKKTPEGGNEDPATERRKRNRRGRTSVPSWDEIVFGAKND